MACVKRFGFEMRLFKNWCSVFLSITDKISSLRILKTKKSVKKTIILLLWYYAKIDNRFLLGTIIVKPNIFYDWSKIGGKLTYKNDLEDEFRFFWNNENRFNKNRRNSTDPTVWFYVRILHKHRFCLENMTILRTKNFAVTHFTVRLVFRGRFTFMILVNIHFRKL